MIVLRVDLLGLGIGYDAAGVRHAPNRSRCIIEGVDGAFIIIFPLGTTKHAKEPHYTLRRESIIILPDDAAFQLREHWPCRLPECTHKRLLLAGTWERHHRREREVVQNGKR